MAGEGDLQLGCLKARYLLETTTAGFVNLMKASGRRAYGCVVFTLQLFEVKREVAAACEFDDSGK
jgi:hypothetical protein